MKAYFVITGLVFLALVVAHVLRVVQERHLIMDPWFIGSTLVSLALAVWAFRLLRAQGSQPPTV
jgi:hypothetical protein